MDTEAGCFAYSGKGRVRRDRSFIFFASKLAALDSQNFTYDSSWNIFESVLMRWINLEPIIRSEVSQK